MFVTGMRPICRIALAGFVALASCKREQPRAAPPPSPAPSVTRDDVVVLVNGKEVAKLTSGAVDKYPRLDTLLPQDAQRLGTWAEITTVTADPSAVPSAIKSPAQAYPDLVPVLFPGADGPAFGMFDPVELAKRGSAKVSHTKIREVRVTLLADGMRGQNDHQGGGIQDPTQLKIQISSTQGQKVLTGPELLAMPRVAQPDGGDHQGWDLVAVLDALGLGTWAEVALADADGVSATVARKDLGADKGAAFLKLNRSGAIRFRVYTKTGTGWATGADVRGLASIKILK